MGLQERGLIERLEGPLSALEANPEWKHDQSGRPDWERSPLAEIDVVLSEADELGFLDDTLQDLGYQSMIFGRRELGHWLLRRLTQVGAGRALSDLETWLEEEEFAAYQLMVLSGFHVEEATELGAGIIIVPAFEIPVSSVRERIMDRDVTMMAGGLSSALVREIRHKKSHSSSVSGSERSERYRPEITWADFETAWLTLTLATRRGPQRTGWTVVAADEVPAARGHGWSYSGFRQPTIGKAMDPVEGAKARKIFPLLRDLPEARRDRLKVPLMRLNLHYVEIDLVQKAIELRIAMEALLLPDQYQHELRYRLSQRAALLLSDDPGERRDIKKTMLDAYDYGSSAIHNGSISRKRRSDARETIQEASELLADAAELIIEEEPDWDRLVFG